jgi:cysteine synthase B
MTETPDTSHPFLSPGEVGQTPIWRLDGFFHDISNVEILVKCEWFNPSGSVKDRAAYWMIRGAEQTNSVGSAMALLDSTSGNTGIALAYFGKKRGHRVTLCIPENVSQERISLLRSLGAQIIFTSALDGDDGARMKAKELGETQSEKYLYLDQYSNPMNWMAHYHGTALEIWRQSNNQVTHFVAGLGTGGTFTGCGRRLNELNSNIINIAVQPDTAYHALDGIKDYESTMVPPLFDPRLVHQTLKVVSEEALEMCDQFEKWKGLAIGPSAGAAIAAAVKIARSLSYGKIIAILPDLRRDHKVAK